MAIAELPNTTSGADGPRRQTMPEAHVAARLCHSRIGRLMGVQVIGTGSFVPERRFATRTSPRWAMTPIGS